jgi:hypothetical protein
MHAAPGLLAAGAALVLLTQPGKAFAEEVPATGKGMVGCGLLGAEAVVITEAAVGVRPAWAYLVGGLAGAGAGVFVGWEVEQNASSQAAVYLLAGGMALIIPATVATLQATSYQPPADYTEDRPSVGAPIPEPPQPTLSPGPPPTAPPPAPPTPAPGSSTETPKAPGPTSLHMHWHAPKLKLPAGLLDLDDGTLKVAIPAMEIRPMYRPDELLKYGLEQRHELRLPVLSATF